MLSDLKHLVRTIRQQAGPPSGDVVRGALTLRSDGTALWKDIEVPLTPAECEIVKLLVQNFPQFVSYDKIYALGRDGPAAAVPDEDCRRTSVRLAVRNIRRKFRDCDPTFRGIQSHRGLGYGWNGPRLARSASRPGHTLAQQAVGQPGPSSPRCRLRHRHEGTYGDRRVLGVYGSSQQRRGCTRVSP